MKLFLTKTSTFLKKNAILHFGLLVVFFLLINLLRLNGYIPVYIADAAATFLIFAVATLGFYILLGFGGLASLGTAAFIGLGSFFLRFFMVEWKLDFIIALALIVLIATVLGLVIGFISLRIEGMYLAIITLVIAEIMLLLFQTSALKGFTGGVNFVNIPRVDFLFGLIPGRTFYDYKAFILIGIVFFIIIILVHNISKSPAGRAMLAMKNSESAAQTMGVNLLKYRLFAFIVATILSMVAGALYMVYMRNSTYSTWNLSLSLNLLAAVVVGGTGSIWGILAGAFVIFGFKGMILDQIPFFTQNPTFNLVISGVLIILVVLFYPGGISQLFKQSKYLYLKHTLKIRTRLAQRRSEKKEKGGTK